MDGAVGPDGQRDAIERSSAGTRKLLVEPVELHALLERMRLVLAHTLGVGVAVSVDAVSERPPMLADTGQLEVLLANLATKVRDAMPEGGTLTLSACLDTVPEGEHPAGLAPGRYVRLAVADARAAMNTARLARAAEPVVPTRMVGDGAGPGLKLARGFAEQSGGRLHIESLPGQGSTVTLWLPEAVAAPQEGTMTLGAGSPRILLVDDDPLVLEAIAGLLADFGYEVMPVEDGPSALGLFDSGEPVDLLVTDLTMPGMDGVAVIREMQRRRPGLPCVLLTAFFSEAAARAVNQEVSGHFIVLRKPVGGPELAERIAALLEGPARDSSVGKIAELP